VAILRLRLADSVRLVTGPINRPDVTYFRAPLERREKETLVELGVRAFDIAQAAAPAWACGGKVIMFTSTARGIAGVLKVRGMPALAYVSNGMTRTVRNDNRIAWEAEPLGILVCTGGFGTGTSTPDVHLVVAFEFASVPIELFQHVGRPAREQGERGVVVLCATAAFAIERLQLLQPTGAGLAGAAALVRLIRAYCTTSCLRAAILEEFGEGLESCSGCDFCCKTGRCSDVACGAGLPELHSFALDRGAAAAILESLRIRPEAITLHQLLAAVPFDTPTGHQFLCLAMLASGALVLSLVEPFHAGMNSVPHVTGSAEAGEALGWSGAVTTSLPCLAGSAAGSAEGSAEAGWAAGWVVRCSAAAGWAATGWVVGEAATWAELAASA
jgi:hypothetical protein